MLLCRCVLSSSLSFSSPREVNFNNIKTLLRCYRRCILIAKRTPNARCDMRMKNASHNNIASDDESLIRQRVVLIVSARRGVVIIDSPCAEICRVHIHNECTTQTLLRVPLQISSRPTDFVAQTNLNVFVNKLLKCPRSLHSHKPHDSSPRPNISILLLSMWAFIEKFFPLLLINNKIKCLA